MSNAIGHSIRPPMSNSLRPVTCNPKPVGHLPCIGDPRQELRGRILATQTRPMDATTGIRGGL